MYYVLKYLSAQVCSAEALRGCAKIQGRVCTHTVAADIGISTQKYMAADIGISKVRRVEREPLEARLNADLPRTF